MENDNGKYKPMDALIIHYEDDDLGKAIDKIKEDGGAIIHQLTRALMKSKYGVGEDEYWITASIRNNNIKPTELSMITQTVSKYAQKQKPVLIEGLEVLIDANGFKEIKELLRNLRDEVSILKSKLVVTLYSGTLEKLEQNQLNMLATQVIE